MIKPIKIYGKRKVGFIENNLIKAHKEWVKGFKVFTARSNNIGTELHDDNLNTKISYPNEIVTEIYLVIGGDIDLNLNSARNLSNYLKTKFSRFLISIAKSTQDAPRSTYKFVPMQDFTLYSDIDWSKSITEIDQQLYKKYKLTKDEIYVINTTIVEMD